MSKATLDPLARIPTPDAIRFRLQETERLAEKLRILLDLSERLHAVDVNHPEQKRGGQHHAE